MAAGAEAVFQDFEERGRPEQGPPRIAALRAEMGREGLAGFLVPRADRHQGEYVAACDERLAWLTGFTGSAGFAAILTDQAGLFVDGRYRVQARQQVDTSVLQVIDWPATRLADWLRASLPEGGRVGFDPWLHTIGEIEGLEAALEDTAITLCPTDNLVDRIWKDRPAPPAAPAFAWPESLAGASAAKKRENIANVLRAEGHGAAVLTLPDSIAWLLNIRGGDIAHVPIAQAFAIIQNDGRVTVFSDPGKFAGLEMGAGVAVAPWEDFEDALRGLNGPVRLDPASAPQAVARLLDAAGVSWARGQDPCILPKARKTPAEIAATRRAHLRDGAAMVNFLAWLDAQPPGSLTEIDVVAQLEAFRRATGELRDISFDTIAGAGPHGAIVHYRVTRASNRRVGDGEILLVDSGGQYLDGTTDVTRTVPVGTPPAGAAEAFTRVLKGMIAISRLTFPAGLAGRDIDAFARRALWEAGLDYAHGTGHGVGVYLSVHEGPQRISRVSDVTLEPGMILSNEPGFYREGAFGIRIENLVVVREAGAIEGGTAGRRLGFETLTWVPIDRRLILPELLDREERAWLDAYHAEVRDKLSPLVDAGAREWLDEATRPLGQGTRE